MTRHGVRAAMSDLQTPEAQDAWSSSPGAMAPSNEIPWDEPVDMWGPGNPNVPAKTWGPRHVVYAALFLVLASAVPSVIALGYVLGTSGGDVATADANTQALLTNGPFLVSSLIFLWAVFAGYPWWVTRFRGSRSMKIDFKLTFNWKKDIAIGLAVAAGLHILEIGMTFLASASGLNMEDASNTGFLVDPNRAIIWTILLVLGAGLGAPFFEELFFRGFVLRAVMRGKRTSQKYVKGIRLSTILAVIISSLFFGSLHLTALTSGGLFVVGMTATLGAIFAILVINVGRLGSSICSHAVFNSVSVGAVLAGAALADGIVIGSLVLGGVAAIYLLILKRSEKAQAKA